MFQEILPHNLADLTILLYICLEYSLIVAILSLQELVSVFLGLLD